MLNPEHRCCRGSTGTRPNSTSATPNVALERHADQSNADLVGMRDYRSSDRTARVGFQRLRSIAAGNQIISARVASDLPEGLAWLSCDNPLALRNEAKAAGATDRQTFAAGLHRDIVPQRSLVAKAFRFAGLHSVQRHGTVEIESLQLKATGAEHLPNKPLGLLSPQRGLGGECWQQ